MTDRSDCCSGSDCCGPTPNRREFLAAASVSAFGSLLPRGLGGGRGPDHFVPADKQLDPAWVARLTARAPVAPWRGEQLRTIGMPCGGVGAGQLYVTGDGQLAHWWIANDTRHSSYGGQTTIVTSDGEQGVCYGTFAPHRPIEQGTLLAWHAGDDQDQVVELGARDFPATSCLGEYPVATIDYERAESPLPLAIRAEVFSPFVPLDARASATPATLLRYTLHNRGDRPIVARLVQYVRNPVLQAVRADVQALSRNVAFAMPGTPALHGVLMDTIDTLETPAGATPEEVFADFENGYGGWRIESGDAFGDAPAEGTLPHQNRVSGFEGKHLVNTFRDGDRSIGVLTSTEFVVRRPFITFRIGGGADLQHLSLALEIVAATGRRVVRRATGQENEHLRHSCWDVREFVGQRAVLVIRDEERGAWGHVNVDDIRFTDAPPPAARATATHPQAGEVALVSLGGETHATADAGTLAELRQALTNGTVPARGSARAPVQQPPLAALAQQMLLAPGQRCTVTFALCWFFPHRRQRDDEGVGPGQPCGTEGPRVGAMYANWFGSALAVARHLAEQGQRLTAATFACRDALYRDTTLPGWLVQRAAASLSTLATGTVQWWENGRLWAWEGVGCCSGTCGHVWNYAMGMAWLFPELERSVRELQDFAPGLGLKRDGAIGFRGTANYRWAGDAQGGYVLKAWREHRLAPDGAFLRRNWPAIKQALGFLIAQDGAGAAPDGLLEGEQHNTYDIEFFGGNTMVGSLYLGALRAGARMATLQGEPEFAAQCEALAARGAEISMQRLWNGEYFVQQVPAEKRDEKYQYGDGCLSDQLLGQWFADTVGLGHLYPRDAVRKALQSIWRYNWAPDIQPQTQAHHPERDFAKPGEAGLFVCTWPKSTHPGERSVRYRDEVWTGIEHQVAAHLLREGFVTEALAIERAIHERYDGTKHNPFNEVECGDHYARALASWSVLLAAAGFECDAPAGGFGFAPRLQPDDFRAFFSAGTGWGTIAQKREAGRQRQEIVVRGGELTLALLAFELPTGARLASITMENDGGAPAAVTFAQTGTRVELKPASPLRVRPGADGAPGRVAIVLHHA